MNWTPTDKEKGRLWVGLGACFIALAIASYLSPSRSSGHRRWGWVHQLFSEAFGQQGDVVLWSVLGLVTVIYGTVLLRRKQD